MIIRSSAHRQIQLARFTVDPFDETLRNNAAALEN